MKQAALPARNGIQRDLTKITAQTVGFTKKKWALGNEQDIKDQTVNSVNQQNAEEHVQEKYWRVN